MNTHVTFLAATVAAVAIWSAHAAATDKTSVVPVCRQDVGSPCGRAALLAAEVPQPAFSFKYGDRAVTGSESMRVDEHLKVTVESVAYPQFNAVEWVLWFENPSAEKSAVLSEILDGNFLVSLPPQPKKFPGDIALSGERAVVTMNGCVWGVDYATDDAASASEDRSASAANMPRQRE